MKKIVELSVFPEIGFDHVHLTNHLSELFKSDRVEFTILKRSIDARKKVLVNLKLEVYVDEKPQTKRINFDYKNVKNSKEVIIIGSGPAGLFAALQALESGFKPIVLERGKNVRERRFDLANINKHNLVNPDSNYCFGEGGAGTYSDGKLYTRSKKRGNVSKILEQLVFHGAKESILYDAHPHIGTNKLPKIIEHIRETIIQHGGEVHFNSKVIDIEVFNNNILNVKTSNGNQFKGEAYILATGHSARDIFYLLHEKNIKMEAKPFALGVRVEHQQQFIDQIQYHCKTRGEFLPAAPYSLVHQTFYDNKQRGVFSFCMCPGGFIVPAATSPGEIVLNGMSPSRRDSKFANSGIVVAINLEDLNMEKDGVFAALNFQAQIEKNAFIASDETQRAPAQLLKDFVQRKKSSTLLDTSYQPGLVSVALNEFFPSDITSRLIDAFTHFNSKIKGFINDKAQILAVESRTSSPIKIPRDKVNLQHVEVQNLYPCGEGAGYAGGIVSAAIDGIEVMKKIAER